MSSRRQFIKDASLASAGVVIASSSFGRFFIPRKPKVIIIGAGFSGLSAAYELYKRKVDFVVVEARSRISGRVFSHPIDPKENLVIELGAEWVGASHTVLQNLCNEFGLILENNQMDTDLIYQGKYYKANEWDFTDDWNKKWLLLKEHYKKLTDAEQRELDRMDWWRYLVNNGCEGRDLDIKELLDSTDFGESTRFVSAFAALSEYAESSPKNEMDLKIKGGNMSLSNKIADKIGRDRILCNHAVSRIVQNPKGGVKVYCANGATFTGDKIICTIPTISAKKIKWEPGLPTAQQNAMNQLQYARINKNPLLFTKKFWNVDRYDLITDQSAHYFYNATRNQPSDKGVLISYTIGDKAAVVANQDDAWRADTVNQVLQPHFGDIRPLLESQVNYYWGNDEYSRGAYAIYGRGQWFTTRDVLSKPHIHTHFAGEHLADWQGFMEGAIETGIAAAQTIK